jgi:hypothetical protein
MKRLMAFIAILVIGIAVALGLRRRHENDEFLDDLD